jgi:hypothetical protein
LRFRALTSPNRPQKSLASSRLLSAKSKDMQRRRLPETLLWLTALAALALLFFYQSRASNRRVAAASDTYLRKARSESSPSTTAADAKAWLEKNGFLLAGLNGNWVGERSEPGRRTNIVQGYRLVEPASVFHGAHWMEIEFVFQTTDEEMVPGAFLTVEASTNPPPKWLTSGLGRQTPPTSAPHAAAPPTTTRFR